MQKIFVVFGYPLLSPAESEFLGAYTTRERAQGFVDAQKPSVQTNMGIEEIALDTMYGDPQLWARSTAGPP